MASTIAQVTDNGTVDTATAWQTASITWTDARRALVAVYAYASSGTAPGNGGTALTGNGQTWVSQANGTHTDGATFTARLQLWSCALSSPSAGVIAATFTTQQPNEVFFKYADCTEAGAVVQASAVNSGSSTAPSSTLAAFADATNNPCFTVIASANGGTSISFEASLAEIGSDLTGGVNANRLAHAWQTGENTTVSGTLGASTNWIALSVEIDNSGGGGAATHPGWLSSRGGWF